MVAAYARHVPPPAAPPAAGAATAADDAAEEESYRQLKSLLELAGQLASRDYGADATAPPGSDGAHEEVVGRAALSCVELLLPRLSPPLLHYPKLCAAYFSLLGHLLDAHPARVFALPPPIAAAVLASVDFGLGHHDNAIATRALNASFELAKQAALQPADVGAAMAPTLQALLHRVAVDVLCSRLHPDLADDAGNALLALILAQPAHWQALVASLLAAQPDAGRRDAAAAAFHALLNANGLTPTLARPNRARFRQNVQGLLQQVQSGGFVMPSG